MTTGVLEILVEPFREADPGPHVLAVVDHLRGLGLAVDMGPFATTAEGELDALTAAAGTVGAIAFEHGATGVQIRIERR